MDKKQLQILRDAIIAAGLIVAAAAVLWALSNHKFRIDQKVALVVLTLATVLVPPIIEQQILGETA